MESVERMEVSVNPATLDENQKEFEEADFLPWNGRSRVERRRYGLQGWCVGQISEEMLNRAQWLNRAVRLSDSSSGTNRCCWESQQRLQKGENNSNSRRLKSCHDRG